MQQKSRDVVVDEQELRRRTIRRSDYISCNQTSNGCRASGSETPENYSIIGPGVARSAHQVVNLGDPHGFNIGAAVMPEGVVNRLQLRFTAEVFLNWSGTWKMRWGADGGDGEMICEEGDIVSVPPWIFRGLTNVGGSSGWHFNVLGFDNTGGTIWGPSVVKETEKRGLCLTADNELIHTVTGDILPENVDVVPPLPQDEIYRPRTFTAEQMQQRVVRQRDLNWSSNPFLCSGLPGGGAKLAAVIGYGMTEDRDQVPPIHYPHNFNLAWLRASRDEGMLQHRHDHTQVLVGYCGTWLVTLNKGGYQVATVLRPYDTISVPAGAWRTFTALDDDAQVLVVNSGDGRVHLEWSSETVRRSKNKGQARDPAGYVAAWNLRRHSTLNN